jgi:hypothetical protein
VSEPTASLVPVNRTESRRTTTLPPVTLTPEEAAAIAVALAARPGGPYAADGRAALEKVLGVLEPDPVRRAQLLATSLWVSTDAGHSAEIRSVVEQAVARRRVLALGYRDGQGRPPGGRWSRSCSSAPATTCSWWRGAGSGRPSAGSGRTASKPPSSPTRPHPGTT